MTDVNLNSVFHNRASNEFVTLRDDSPFGEEAATVMKASVGAVTVTVE